MCYVLGIIGMAMCLFAIIFMVDNNSIDEYEA